MNYCEAGPVELHSSATSVRVGVIVCDCEGKISKTIDTETLCQKTLELPEVVYALHESYPCSKDGQARLLNAIREQRLDRILIAGCSPRLMSNLFRRVGQSAGLASSYINIANIREQCVYVHPNDRIGTFEKAVELVEMGVERLSSVTATQPRSTRVVKSALVIGSDLSALTVAHSLVESSYPVIIVENQPELGGQTPDDLRKRTRLETITKGKEVLNFPQVQTLFNAQVTAMTGHPGDYVLRVQQGQVSRDFNVGAVVVAHNSRPKNLGESRWFDRSRVKTQAEFEAELEQAAKSNDLPLNNIVMILCAEEVQRKQCSRVCCNIGIRQARLARQLNPSANITILFRELYLGGITEAYEYELLQARKEGVTFFRYRADRPPIITNQTVDLLDNLTGEPLRLKFDRVVMTMPLVPPENTGRLAAILGLPLDEDGFLAEPRLRLRSEGYADPGIYVLGSAQQPADADESLFQAYLTSARVNRFLGQESIHIETPAAHIDSNLCTGCGNCAHVCPVAAIALESRDGILSLSEVDAMRCYGCGNCVVACPVKAISLPGWDSVEIPVQISAALQSPSFQRVGSKIIVLGCEWSAYAAADTAGARHISYPANVRIIRTNCSARFDPYHILWAFLNGADGVFLGACPPGDCHYGSGNLYARERVDVLKKELLQHGVDPRRLRLEFFTVEDGYKFAQAMAEFVAEVGEMGKMVPRH